VNVVKTIITVIFVIICIFLSAVILLQEGKQAGLSGSISGMAESYWGRNKSRSMEGKLEKLTKVAAFLWIVLALVLDLKFW
jgi:preprotein translocase subunit SecG